MQAGTGSSFPTPEGEKGHTVGLSWPGDTRWGRDTASQGSSIAEQSLTWPHRARGCGIKLPQGTLWVFGLESMASISPAVVLVSPILTQGQCGSDAVQQQDLSQDSARALLTPERWPKASGVEQHVEESFCTA